MVCNDPSVKDLPKLIIPITKFLFTKAVTVSAYAIIYPFTFIFAVLGSFEYLEYSLKVVGKIWDSKKRVYIIKFSYPGNNLIIPARNRTLADRIRAGDEITFKFNLKFTWPIPKDSDFLEITS